jgi:PAS domain-containing protein
MARKPTYEELEQRIREFEKESAKRKQAEEELRESEEKYRSVLENMEEGYWEVDLLGNFTFFNDSLCKFFGYSRDELLGMNNRKYTTPKMAARITFIGFT